MNGREAGILIVWVVVVVSIAVDGLGTPSSSYTMSFHDTITAICFIFVVVVAAAAAAAVPTAADNDDDDDGSVDE